MVIIVNQNECNSVVLVVNTTMPNLNISALKASLTNSGNAVDQFIADVISDVTSLKGKIADLEAGSTLTQADIDELTGMADSLSSKVTTEDDLVKGDLTPPPDSGQVDTSGGDEGLPQF